MARLDPDRVISDAGRRIAELREERGWTQERAASRLDVSAKYLQRVECGRANLTLVSLVRFANLFQVPLADMLFKPTSKQRGRGRPKRLE